MSRFDEILGRIKIATHTRTQVELAEVLDIRQSSISDAKRRNSVPADWCLKLFERFGLNPDWLKHGVGPMYLRAEQGYDPAEENTSPAGLPLAALAVSSVAAAENPAMYADSGAKGLIVSVYSMRSWPEEEERKEGEGVHVARKLNLPVSLLGPTVKVYLLDSTSMEPFFPQGAYLGVDAGTKAFYSNEFYAFALPCEGICIKRLFHYPDKIVLLSENQQYPEISMSLEETKEVLLGRVVWSINHY
ncbi:DNA-binding protein [Deltaproteobacteria bacterium]|nr:DNA-binding protein [Deltaproteobacteria bacterium]